MGGLKGLLILGVFAVSSAFAGEAPLKVLTIGNSFSYSLHSHWAKVAEGLGEKLDFATLYIGGCPLKRHADNIRESEADPTKKQYAFDRNTLGVRVKRTAASVQSALASESWDVVTIQQASHESWRPESYQPWGDEIVACVRRLAPQARLVVQQTWSYSDRDGRICEAKGGGAGSWGFDQTGMYERLKTNYRDLANRYGARQIPTGEAVQRFRAMLPVKGVDDDVVGRKGDSIHLNSDGDYLQALVWSAALFGDDVTQCAYVPESLRDNPVRAGLIRRAAAEAAGSEALLKAGLGDIIARCAVHYKALDAAATREMKDVKGELRTPHTYDSKKKALSMSWNQWWTAGHFPGSLWYLYEATGDVAFRDRAKAWTEILSTNAWITSNHDVGFIMYCSYGNARRLLKTKEYDGLLVQTAKSLCKRYDEGLGLIRSWGPLDGKKDFLVIPDNLMNLELLEWAAKNAPEAQDRGRFWNIAASHADVTMRHHYRADGGCYHVLDYDQTTKRVKSVYRGQGASVETAWSRGQSWTVYGYTMLYRMTGLRRYLDMAVKTADFALNHLNMPDDCVPYWDYGAPGEERDSSAGAILASALIELSQYVDAPNACRYRSFAAKALWSLSSSAYFSEGDEIGHFLLKHGVGNKPGDSEIDVPLDYGDYYYLEALLRFRALVARDAALAPLESKLPVRAGLPADEFDFRRVTNYPDAKTNSLLDRAEKLLKDPIPATTDELYAEFWSTGNRRHYEMPFFKRLDRMDTLVEAECAEQKGRFVTRIEDYVRAICDMKSWVLPAHDWTDGSRGTFRGTCLSVDLFCSEVAANLACVLAKVGDKLDPDLVRRVKVEAERRVFAPLKREMPFRFIWDGRQDYCANMFHWWADGDNNWNAVCWDNVVCAAQGLLDCPRERAYFVDAALKGVPFYLKGGFEADGYCSEGMGYWNYGFGHHLRMGRLLDKVTDGKLMLFTEPKQALAAAYARSYTLLEGVSPAFADGCGAAGKQNLALVDAYWPDLAKGLGPMSEFPVGQVWLLRDPKGLSVAFKGGHNGEHHNHNDLGSYYVVVNGKPVAGDPGGEEYTRFTFSDRRYESKVLNSYGHPVPVVGGKLQETGREHAAKVVLRDFGDDVSQVVLDLTDAYDVKTLKRLTRMFVYSRKAKTFAVTDQVEFTLPTAFETAFVTLSDDAAASPSVTAEGGKFEIATEKIANPNRLEPSRTGIRFRDPVLTASVTCTFAGQISK